MPHTALYLFIVFSISAMLGCSQPATGLDKLLLEVTAMDDETLATQFVPKSCRRHAEPEMLSRELAEIRINLAGLLIDAGADIDARDGANRTPLMNAAQADREDLAAVLAFKGARLDLKDGNDQTAEQIAREHKNKKTSSALYQIESFIDQSKKDQTELNERLVLACSDGSAGAARFFLDSGADVNGRPDAWPLKMAVYTNTEAVRLLLERGADVDARDQDGQIALFMAVNAARDGTHVADLGTVKVLLEHTSDINKVIERGASQNTALTTAVYSNSVTACELLLQSGADPNFELPNGDRALFIALNLERMAIIKLLIRYGVDLNQVDADGIHPLLFTTDNEIFSLLIQNGANVNFVFKNGESLLMRTVEGRMMSQARAFIENGADVNYVSPDGKTALSLAEGDFVSLLKNAGARR